MSVLSKFESTVEGAVDGAAAAVFASPIEPAQIAKKAEKQMKREKLVGSGRQYAPTLYNVLVSERDDQRLLGFYPTMASEIENYLYAKGTEAGMEFDTRPLVRFIPDPGLKKGRFDVIAEVVSAPIIQKLRAEELEYYGLATGGSAAPQTRAPHPLDKALPGLGVGAPVAPAAGASAGVRPFTAPGTLPSLEFNTPVASEGSRATRIPEIAQPIRQGQGYAPHAQPSAASRENLAQTPTQTPVKGEEEFLDVIGNASLYNSAAQRSYRLKRRKLTAGRDTDNEIVLLDANASRVHARFSQDATGRWKLTDLGSTNGTLLNGRPVTSAILRSGDEITIGTSVLQFME